MGDLGRCRPAKLAAIATSPWSLEQLLANALAVEVAESQAGHSWPGPPGLIRQLARPCDGSSGSFHAPRPRPQPQGSANGWRPRSQATGASQAKSTVKALGQGPADPTAQDPLTLPALDAFLAFAQADGTLAERLRQPLELEELLALGRSHGFALEAEDVLAAQQREEASLSAAELQQRAGADARKLRSFIPG